MLIDKYLLKKKLANIKGGEYSHVHQPPTRPPPPTLSPVRLSELFFIFFPPTNLNRTPPRHPNKAQSFHFSPPFPRFLGNPSPLWAAPIRVIHTLPTLPGLWAKSLFFFVYYYFYYYYICCCCRYGFVLMIVVHVVWLCLCFSIWLNCVGPAPTFVECQDHFLFWLLFFMLM